MLEISPPMWGAAAACLLLAALFAVGLKRYLRGREVWRYDPKAAWLRAATYLSVCWALAFAVGTVPTILDNPWVFPGQTGDWLWWAVGGLALVVVLVGYGIVWPAGTRPHGRRIVWPDTLLFGIAWGLGEGLLFGSVWLAAKRFWDAVLGAGTGADFAILFTAIVLLSAFLGLWHALYWDIHVSPEHNIAEWNSRKVLFAHTPNLVVSGIWVTAYGNLGLYVGLQALALILSSMAMPFPSFRRPLPPDPDGPALGPPTDEPADVSGKTVVITGGAQGIGAVIARRLADAGATVVIVDRDAAAARPTAAALGTAPVIADLAIPEQTRRAAAELVAAHPRIDVLINNAGVFHARYIETPDGVEDTLASNHLSGFLLTELLREHLAPDARVVFVSSDAHRQAKAPDFADLNCRAAWKGKESDPNAGFVAYNQSKLLVTASALDLAERWAGSGITINVVTPGALVLTGIFDEVTGPFALFTRVFRPLLRTPEEAAQTAVYLASSPEVAGASGWYFKDRRATAPSRRSQDRELQQRLRRWSTSAAGLSDTA